MQRGCFLAVRAGNIEYTSAPTLTNISLPMMPTKIKNKLARAEVDQKKKTSAAPLAVDGAMHRMIFRNKKSQLVRQHIAEVAVPLFELKGFAETTVEEITKASGYSTSTFYRLFADKGEVVFFDYPVMMEELKAVFALPNHGNAWDTIQRIFIEVAHNMDVEEGQLDARCARLFHNEPVLYARYLAKNAEWENEIAKLVSAEIGGDPKQVLFCQLITGAITLAFRAAWRTKLADESLLLADCLRKAYSKLEKFGNFFQTLPVKSQRTSVSRSRKALRGK
jgi:AcrR family transcriptional regulator